MVVPALVERGIEVRGLVHEPSKEEAARAAGATETVVADLADVDALAAAADGLRANPNVEIEAAIDGEIQTVGVRAEETTGLEYDVAFARFVDRSPAFKTYQRRATRRLPVIRLTTRVSGTRSAEGSVSATSGDR